MYNEFTHNVVDRPGYFGKARPQKIEQYNEKFGFGDWEECWQIRDRYCSFEEAVLLYDMSYRDYLHQHTEILNYICNFEECYDDHVSNIASGLKHDASAVPRHIQDVSTRRAVFSLGRWFKLPETEQVFSINDFNKLIIEVPTIPMSEVTQVGDRYFRTSKLLQIRGIQTNGYILNPGRVPFVSPELIYCGDDAGRVPKWVEMECSVESFWQRNKVIVTAR